MLLADANVVFAALIARGEHSEFNEQDSEISFRSSVVSVHRNSGAF